MIYLGNGMYSDSGSSLSHGGAWKTHKYIAIRNGRYIYPDDVRTDRRRPIHNPNNYHNVNSGKKRPDFQSEKRWKKHTEGLTRPYAAAAKNKIYNFKTSTMTNLHNYKVSKQGPSAAELAQRKKVSYGKSAATEAEKNYKAAQKKVYDSKVSKQGPSAAELAQRKYKSIPMSRNVNWGSKNVKYNTNKPTEQGPSAAELAQRKKVSYGKSSATEAEKNYKAAQKKLKDSKHKQRNLAKKRAEQFIKWWTRS